MKDRKARLEAAIERALAGPAVKHTDRNPAEGTHRVCTGPINYLPKNHQGRY